MAPISKSNFLRHLANVAKTGLMFRCLNEHIFGRRLLEQCSHLET
jgi:hypothetical protein